MPAFIVTTTERSAFASNAPTYDQIRNAMMQAHASRFAGDPRVGNWIGAPRVTRPNPPLGQRFATNVAWLYSFPDDAFFNANSTQLLQALKDNVDAALGTVSSDFSDAQVTPYNPSIHGDLNFWQSGEAGRTRTRDHFPELGERLTTNENPTGPNGAGQNVSVIQRDLTDPLLRPLQNATNSVASTTANVGRTIVYGAGILAAGVAIYIGARVYLVIRAENRRGARRNPSRRTKRRARR